MAAHGTLAFITVGGDGRVRSTLPGTVLTLGGAPIDCYDPRALRRHISTVDAARSGAASDKLRLMRYSGGSNRGVGGGVSSPGANSGFGGAINLAKSNSFCSLR